MAYIKNKIKSKRKEEFVKPYRGVDGRMKVNLYGKNNVLHVEDLAELIAKTFPEQVDGVQKPGSLPMFKDGNPENCAAFNLYWE